MKLQRGIYVLEDAFKIWYELITRRFTDTRSKEMESVPSVFHGTWIMAVCYVDDLLVLVNSEKQADAIKRSFSDNFVMKDPETSE